MLSIRHLILCLTLPSLAAVSPPAPAGDKTIVLETLVRGPAAATEFAQRLSAELAPADLAREFLTHGELVPPTLRRLGMALSELPEGPAATRLATYLTACSRAVVGEIARRGPPFTAADLDLVLVVQLVDPLRFVEEPRFRARVLELLPHAFERGLSPQLRDRLLYELNQVRGIGFDESERIELGWGAAVRPSGERRLPYEVGRFRLPSHPQEPIVASIFSLSSPYFTPEEVERFLAALGKRAPRRQLVVLTDLPLRTALGSRIGVERIRLIETYGRGYTPWPRDPFLLARRGDGGVVVVQRPNRQGGREEDVDLARELIQGLPGAVDEAWHGVHWTTAPMPFHNGQLLLTEGAAWLSIHTPELRILELLGCERVPVASFATAGGIDRYLGAAQAAAAELETLYGRPARFVHPLPVSGPIAERSAMMQRLGGGAGFDLDSLLTLVPAAAGPAHALVADPREGLEFLRRLPAEDWQRLRRGYRIGTASTQLRRALEQYQRSPRVEGLAAFLELIAEHLESEGFRVRRLPFFLVPMEMLAIGDEIDFPDFQITWNNVVIETTPQGLRAEGFSSLLAAGDEQARAAFAAAGCRLELLPPLIGSIVRNGGYRCASNHLRAAD